MPNFPQLFKQIHGGERRSIVRSTQSNPSPSADRPPRPDVPRHRSRPRFPSTPTPRSKSRAPSMDISVSADRIPYEGRETTRRPRVSSLTTLHGSRRRRSVVSEGHTSPDEDGESRKRVGATSARSHSATHRASMPPPSYEQGKIPGQAALPEAQFDLQLDKLVDLLPHVDRNVLAGYLRRTGQDILAVGKYLEDERNGTVV